MMVKTMLLKIIKLRSDMDITEIKQIVYATNIKNTFNSLTVIIRQVFLLRCVLYKGRSITPKL